MLSDDARPIRPVPNEPDDVPPPASNGTGGRRRRDLPDVPHDPAAEAGLIGSALLHGDRTICDISPSDFYTPAHFHIAGAIQHLLEHDQPADSVTVANQLGPGGLELIGGASTLVDLLARAPHRGGSGAYLDIIQGHATARRLIAVADTIRQAGYASDVEGALHALHEARETVGAPASSWQPVDLAAVIAGEDTEPGPTMLRRNDGQALLYPGKVHAFNAESESGKSWLALWASAERIFSAEHVVYLDFEDEARNVTSRLTDLGVDPDEIVARFHYIRPDDPFDQAARRSLEVTIDQHQPSLAVLDGVTEAMVQNGWSILDNDDIARFLHALPRMIARSGAAVVIIDHVTKDKEARGRYGIGGQHKLAGVDVAYSLDVLSPFGRGLDGAARLTVTKDRPGWIRPASVGGKITGEVRLTSNQHGANLEIVPPAQEAWDGPTECMSAVLSLLAAIDGGELSQARLETQMKAVGHPFRRQTIRDAAERLALGGRISARTGPRNARLYRLDPTQQTNADPLPDDEEKF